MAASMFMNSNSLPIALMQSLVTTVHHLKWTPDDSKNAMIGRALTYLVLYSTMGMIVSRSPDVFFASDVNLLAAALELRRQTTCSGRRGGPFYNSGARQRADPPYCRRASTVWLIDVFCLRLPFISKLS